MIYYTDNPGQLADFDLGQVIQDAIDAAALTEFDTDSSGDPANDASAAAPDAGSDIDLLAGEGGANMIDASEGGDPADPCRHTVERGC